MFTVPRGATGFWGRHDPRPPVMPVKAFRAAHHEAARAARLRPGPVTERTYPGNFHSALLGDSHGILFHAAYPWIAVIVANSSSWESPGVFLEPPPWSAAFTDAGFTVLDRETLDAPLTAADTTALTKAEWTQIHSWKPPSVGETIFNSWD